MYNNRKSNNKSNKPAPVIKKFSLSVNGHDGKKEYDIPTLYSVLEKLQSNGIFDVLNIPLSAPKSACFNDENARGTINVARILGFDAESNTMDVIFFGSNAKFADIGDVIIPHVRVSTYNNAYKLTITSFEVIEKED